MKNNDMPICHMSRCAGKGGKCTSGIHPVESQMCFLPDGSMCYGTAAASLPPAAFPSKCMSFTTVSLCNLV